MGLASPTRSNRGPIDKKNRTKTPTFTFSLKQKTTKPTGKNNKRRDLHHGQDPKKTPPIPSVVTQGDNKESRGGFYLGDHVKVVSVGSAYHGQRGVVVAFCKNGSEKNVYVQLNKDGQRMLSVNSIRKENVQNSTESTGTPSEMSDGSPGRTRQ